MTTTPRRLRLIVNGKAFDADAKRATLDRLEAAVQAARATGTVVDWSRTEAAGDAERHAAEAAGLGYDTVVAVGGDGTLHEVVNGVTEGLPSGGVPQIAVGVIPLGTANDFASAVGLTAATPEASLDVILHGEPRLIDVPAVNGRRFVNVVTGGVPAQATTESSAAAKDQIGDAAYLVAGLRKLTAPRPKARFSGPKLHWKGRFDVLAVGNGTQAGGGWKLCRNAMLDDGLLDVLIVPTHFRWGMFFLASVLVLTRGLARLLYIEPRHEGGRAIFKHGVFGEALSVYREAVIERRVDRLTIQSHEELQLNLDGEPVRAKAFAVVLAARVRVYLPVP